MALHSSFHRTYLFHTHSHRVSVFLPFLSLIRKTADIQKNLDRTLAMASQAIQQDAPAAGAVPRKAEELSLAGKAPSGAGGEAPMPSGCLPRFSVPRFASPRLYFASLTPRTKQTVGGDDYTEALREMRGVYPNSADADMVPFIRVCKVCEQMPICRNRIEEIKRS